MSNETLGAESGLVRERPVGRERFGLDDAASRRPSQRLSADADQPSTREEEDRSRDERPSASEQEQSLTGHAPRAERQSIGYCPYCSEENLFPLEGGGWECRSCLRAFSVTFRGLVSPSRSGREDPR